MADVLPDEYDVIVLGTGLGESIVAAACSRIGQKVLHLDRNDHYSGDWATFNFDGMQKWIAGKTQDVGATGESTSEAVGDLNDGETALKLTTTSNSISGVKQYWFISDDLPEIDTPAPTVPNNTPAETEQNIETLTMTKSTEEQVASKLGPTITEEGTTEDSEAATGADEDNANEDKTPIEPETPPEKSPAEKKSLTITDVKKQWRKFNIDLEPKVLYCRGPLVELLISSDIAKYCEFKTVSRVLTHMNGKLEKVPCSRADVFASRAVSMIEKRMLMKFLNSCLDYERHPEEYEAMEERPFREYLQSLKLTANIQHYVLHAISMGNESMTTIEGLRATHKFLNSLGRYGNTSFLWPLYGTGELPQAFCRLCAVFGGVYCLRRAATHLILDSERNCLGIMSGGQKLKCKWLVMEASYTSRDVLPQIRPPRQFSRAIYLTTNGSIHPYDKEEITLLRLPHPQLTNPATVIELSPTSYAMPDNMHLVHITCESIGDPEDDMKHFEELLFQPRSEENTIEEGTEVTSDGDKPHVVWCVYFTQTDYDTSDDITGLPGNVAVCNGPDGRMDFGRVVAEARNIFERICPDEEFLPRAPNPEDIIYDDGDQGNPPEAHGGFGNGNGQGYGSTQEGERLGTSAVDLHGQVEMALGPQGVAAIGAAGALQGASSERINAVEQQEVAPVNQQGAAAGEEQESAQQGAAAEQGVSTEERQDVPSTEGTVASQDQSEQTRPPTDNY